jgi:hypothetical protein
MPKELRQNTSSRLSLPSSATCPGNVCSTSLEVLQDLRRIRAIHIKRVLIRRVAATNLLDNVVRVCSTNDWDFRGEPLLKGLCDEVAVCGEPAGHGRANGDFLCEAGSRGCEDDVAFVDGNVLFCVRRNADLEWVVSTIIYIHEYGVRTVPVFPWPSYTTPFSTNHNQYENAPFRMK